MKKWIVDYWSDGKNSVEDWFKELEQEQLRSVLKKLACLKKLAMNSGCHTAKRSEKGYLSYEKGDMDIAFTMGSMPNKLSSCLRQVIKKAKIVI
jgi:hypothetical protein